MHIAYMCRTIIALATIMSMQWRACMCTIRCHSPCNDVPVCAQSDVTAHAMTCPFERKYNDDNVRMIDFDASDSMTSNNLDSASYISLIALTKWFLVTNTETYVQGKLNCYFSIDDDNDSFKLLHRTMSCLCQKILLLVEKIDEHSKCCFL